MFRPRILLTGSSGQLGHELAQTLAPLCDLLAPGRDQLDLADPHSIRNALRRYRPHVVINAAAYTAVDAAETDTDAVFAINAAAPAVIAAELRTLGGALVHFSTDYVFDGTKAAPYTEDDLPCPVNAYGRSKLQGEEAIVASGAPHWILRTEWLYSARGKNFLRTILRLASERDELRVVNDQRGAPTSARALAAAVVAMLAPDSAANPGDRIERTSGIYHVAAAGETTWHGFATAILQQFASASASETLSPLLAGFRPRLCRVLPIPASDYPTPAARPANSVFSMGKLSRVFGVSLRDWRAELLDTISSERSARVAGAGC